MENVDLIFHNCKVYTLDSSFSITNSLVVNDGKIIETGNFVEIQKKYKANNIIDLDGKTVIPSFYDSHCHFLGYGTNLIKRADLVGAKSKDEVLNRLKKFDLEYKNEWIEGRGWDQNLWPIKDFPDKKDLDKYFPDKPVYLIRIDGHAAWVNSKALELAKISHETKVNGGEIILKEGKPSGVLIDKAMDLVRNLIPDNNDEFNKKALLKAQENCFAVGITSIADAGLTIEEINLISKLQNENLLKMRIFAMLEVDSNSLNYLNSKNIIKTDNLNFSSVKLYADGALGSRGALMLEDYSDNKGNKGIRILDQKFFEKVCDKAINEGFQVCTHAIGDSANRFVIDTYGKFLEKENDKRWRIEHCQVVDEKDFNKFSKYSIIPSVQPTHATSDMNWAVERLGKIRINNAYGYKKLLAQNNWIAFGSDFPIENINPLFGIYSAVSRKDFNGMPTDGFQAQNAVSIKDAVLAYTLWAAKASFEEDKKGSLEKGKFADFIVLDEDIFNIESSKIPNIKVLKTFSSGIEVYKAE